MRQELTAEAYLERILTQEVRDDCPVRRTLELLKWKMENSYHI